MCAFRRSSNSAGCESSSSIADCELLRRPGGKGCMILTIGKKEQGTDIVEEDMSAGGATCSGLVGRSLARWLARCESLSRAGRKPKASESQQLFEINKVDSSQMPH